MSSTPPDPPESWTGGPGPGPGAADPANPSPGTIPGAGARPLAPGSAPPPTYQPAYVPPGQLSLSPLAIAAVALGVLWLGGIGSILAIVLGVVARKEISGGTRRGSGAATAGIALGVLGLAASLIVGVSLLGRAGSDSNAGPKVSPDGSTVVTTIAPGGPTTTSLGPIGEAQTFACDYDLKGLQAATETYEAVEGHPPTSQQDLLDTGYLVEESTLYAVAPPVDGAIVIKLSPAGVAAGCLPP